MKRRDHEKALRKLLSQPPNTISQFLQVKQWNQSSGAHHEDDRETILISFTFLEDSVKLLLRQHLDLMGSNRGDRLFDSDGGREAVLGSLYSRGLMAESLDLISKACETDLKTISLIRNTFAHTGHYLKFDNPSLIFLADLQTISKLGERYELRLADGDLLFDVNLQTPRARILGFIMLFWVYCSIIQLPGTIRPMAEIFGPELPLPDKPAPQVMSDSAHQDQMQAIRENPPRSSRE